MSITRMYRPAAVVLAGFALLAADVADARPSSRGRRSTASRKSEADRRSHDREDQHGRHYGRGSSTHSRFGSGRSSFGFVPRGPSQFGRWAFHGPWGSPNRGWGFAGGSRFGGDRRGSFSASSRGPFSSRFATPPWSSTWSRFGGHHSAWWSPSRTSPFSRFGGPPWMRGRSAWSHDRDDDDDDDDDARSRRPGDRSSLGDGRRGFPGFGPHPPFSRFGGPAWMRGRSSNSRDDDRDDDDGDDSRGRRTPFRGRGDRDERPERNRPDERRNDSSETDSEQTDDAATVDVALGGSLESIGFELPAIARKPLAFDLPVAAAIPQSDDNASEKGN